MEFPKKLNLNAGTIAKIGLVLVLAIALLSLGKQFLGNGSMMFSQKLGGIGMGSTAYDMAAPSPSYPGMAGNYAREESAQLSIRNVDGIMPPITPGVPGSDAEAYEVKQYNVYIETRDREKTCDTILNLKGREDVIFENANAYEHGCSYTFKVKTDKAAEILAMLEQLDPRDVSEQAYTIKRQIDDFTSEVDILTKKKESIEATLEDAITSYDNLTRLANSTEDVETLAKIIESKIRIIEQLTQERINVNEQLDRLTRAKEEQLDRLEYTYFYVSVAENKFVDGQQIKDSWKEAVKEAVRDANHVLQQLSVGLIALLLLAAQYVLYAFIILVIVKYAWKWGKKFWKN